MKRRGISLNEVLIVVSMMALLMPLCGQLIWTLARENREALRSGQERRNLLRLIEKLKADSLQARQCSLGEEMQFELADGSRLRYLVTAQGVERRQFEQDQLVHRENFYFPPSFRLTWESGDDAHTQVTALLTRSAPRAGLQEELRILLPVAASMNGGR